MHSLFPHYFLYLQYHTDQNNNNLKYLFIYLLLIYNIAHINPEEDIYMVWQKENESHILFHALP